MTLLTLTKDPFLQIFYVNADVTYMLKNVEVGWGRGAVRDLLGGVRMVLECPGLLIRVQSISDINMVVNYQKRY